jgi:hypothetical protein
MMPLICGSLRFVTTMHFARGETSFDPFLLDSQSGGSPELELMFNRLEVDVAAASAAAADLDLAHLPQPGPGDVLDGILG